MLPDCADVNGVYEGKCVTQTSLFCLACDLAVSAGALSRPTSSPPPCSSCWFCAGRILCTCVHVERTPPPQRRACRVGPERGQRSTALHLRLRCCHNCWTRGPPIRPSQDDQPQPTALSGMIIYKYPYSQTTNSKAPRGRRCVRMGRFCESHCILPV